MPRQVLFRQVGIVGVGLIGGAVGLALRRRGLAGRVVGVCRREEAAREAERLGAVDRATLSLAEGARESELLLLATDVAQAPRLAAEALPALPDGAILTDVGSTKRRLVERIEEAVATSGRAVSFVGSHPITGGEQQGVASAAAVRLEGAPCVLTPTARTPAGTLAAVRDFWRALGMRTLELAPAEHDRILARTSHLPHFVAAALLDLVGESELACSAGGLRDMTRIASGDPGLWAAIGLENREELARALAAAAGRLTELADLVTRGERAALEEFLARAKARRDVLPAPPPGPGSSPPGPVPDGK